MRPKQVSAYGMSSRDFGLIQISSIGTCPSWNCDL